jgi:ABC-type branched-subunit amino acid transport system substrate-binding protein
LPNSSDHAPAVALTLVAAVAAATATSACSGQAEEDVLSVGLLLSYSGHGAATTTNSERALLMAFEAADAAGGVGGRPVRALARDTRSDPSNVLMQAQELLDAGVPLVIGPDTNDLAIATRSLLSDRTVILPSFATAAASDFKAPSWFVMGVTVGRVACEFMAEMRADGHQSPLLIYDPNGYSASLAWDLSFRFGLPKIVLTKGDESSSSTLALIAAEKADSFVLAATPPSATPLVYGLLATGGITDPARWYLSPTLHSPVFLQSVPRGALLGAHGVAQGTSTDGSLFAQQFALRWQEPPLDDAFSFYDAGALAVLSLQRALVKEGAIPSGTGLSKHLVKVTSPGGVPVRWNEIAQGLAHLRAGEEVTYGGVSGSLEFDALGYARGALTSWWTISPDGFAPREGHGDCQ